MKNGWTGGQYSLYRAFFGLYLFIHFLQLLPWSGELFSHQGMLPDGRLSPLMAIFPNILAVGDAPFFVAILCALGMVASLFFIVGKGDRIAALFLWYVLACFFGRNPLIANPSLPFVGWLLLAHLFIPKANLKGGWEMPTRLFFVAWMVMSVGYSYSGVLKLSSPSWIDGSACAFVLQNPLSRGNWACTFLQAMPTWSLQLFTWGALALELLFVVFALSKRLRPLAWTLMLLMHLGILCLVNFADLTLGMLMVHFFTFDPAWIKPRPINEKLKVFYDGTCGFCHAFVQFVLAENRSQAPFRFAPLQGAFPEIPKSIVVQEDGKPLYKSEAVFRVLASLGGLWRLLAIALSFVPKVVSDGVYDLVAKVRHRLFPKPKEACPLIPADLRVYFEE